MEIRHLRTFLAVARLLSFNKAADRLNYAQSSISAQIHALEEELGVQLFDRLGRQVALTDPGERLIEYSEKILHLADEARADIGSDGEPAGSLTIRIPESLGVHRLPAVIKEFRRRFPRVRLNLTTCAHESLRNDLHKGLIDAAFLFAESVVGADLEVETLGFESIVPVASPDHALARKEAVTTRDLEKEPILLSQVDCSYRRLFEQVLDEQNVAPENTITFQSVETLKRCVMEGVGITILPEIAVSADIADGRLTRLAWTDGTFEVAVLLIRYRGRWLSPALKAFAEITKEVFTENWQ